MVEVEAALPLKGTTMNLDRYQEHHAEIHGLLEDLNRRLQPGAFDALGARQLMVTLGARLNIHLAFEDRALYPTLLGSPDAAVREKTTAYMNEVGGLKEALTAHLKRWLSTTEVLAAPEPFRVQTLDFLRALERRLRAEDQDFYPFIATRA
ncbi:hemerythrin domain-containing protein [Mesoterricola silvestris]|uniref:Hemerythrin-like domain-containing protein n=1 Tax=Mesoterricola silvestris TaxID=2927979 RepID=A0AA48GW66_9BACT|nr:hemerythrin domain-containing protein [Mesoterricola silvestris]BDU72961.1 hypothetical protein METEAL_21350 [Mesoterricola silvestris]